MLLTAAPSDSRCSLSYLLGAILFVEGSVAWMVPAWGDAERGAPPDTAHALVEWPYFWGSLLVRDGAAAAAHTPQHTCHSTRRKLAGWVAQRVAYLSTTGSS